MSDKNNRISVLHKMNTNVNPKLVAQECTVPQNSSSNLRNKHGFSEALNSHMSGVMDSSCNITDKNKCPHCENMAKNFLYLESLIRHNYNKKQQCNLCNSSLKYLQYVNRNIMQVFGHSEAVMQAAKSFQETAPLPIVPPNRSVSQPNAAGRIVAGAAKTTPTTAKTLGKSAKKSKSLNSSKLGKTLKVGKTSKSRQKLTGQLRRLSSSVKHLTKSKMAVNKLKNTLHQVVRSASQYQNLRARRNSKKLKSKSTAKGKGDLIQWRLLKQNMPKRKKKDALKKANKN